MIQDMLGNELYVGAYKVKSKNFLSSCYDFGEYYWNGEIDFGFYENNFEGWFELEDE